jgi:hypothetical protein
MLPDILFTRLLYLEVISLDRYHQQVDYFIMLPQAATYHRQMNPTLPHPRHLLLFPLRVKVPLWLHPTRSDQGPSPLAKVISITVHLSLQIYSLSILIFLFLCYYYIYAIFLSLLSKIFC